MKTPSFSIEKPPRDAAIEGAIVIFYRAVSRLVYGKPRITLSRCWRMKYRTRKAALAAKRKWIKDAKIARA